MQATKLMRRRKERSLSAAAAARSRLLSASFLFCLWYSLCTMDGAVVAADLHDLFLPVVAWAWIRAKNNKQK